MKRLQKLNEAIAIVKQSKRSLDAIDRLKLKLGDLSELNSAKLDAIEGLKKYQFAIESLLKK